VELGPSASSVEASSKTNNQQVNPVKRKLNFEGPILCPRMPEHFHVGNDYSHSILEDCTNLEEHPPVRPSASNSALLNDSRHKIASDFLNQSNVKITEDATTILHAKTSNAIPSDISEVWVNPDIPNVNYKSTASRRRKPRKKKRSSFQM